MTTTPHRPPRRQNPNFFARDPDGSVRLRVRLTGETASLVEEAAGRQPLMDWLYKAIEARAREDIELARASRPRIDPPVET